MMAASSDARRTTRICDLLCLIAVITGLGLRFHRLGEPLWYDEAVSIKTASVPLAQLPSQLTKGEDSNPPLYPLLLKAWIPFVGGSDASVHALSALIGVAVVASAGWAGFALGGASSGLATAALASLHPWALVYSQEARAYGLLVLFGLWSCLSLTLALERERWRDWLAFGLATTAGLYSHNYAAFLLLGQLHWIIHEARRRPRLWRPASIAVGAALLAYLPWLGFVWRQAHTMPSGYPLPEWRSMLVTLFSSGGLWVMAGRTYFHWPASAMTPIFLAEVWLAWQGLRSLRKRRPDLAWGLCATALVSVAVPVLISNWYQLYLPGRHNIICLPALLLLAGLALDGVAPVRRLGALLFLLAAFAFPDTAYFATPKSFERDIAAYMAERIQPGYKILLYPDYRGVSIGRYFPPALEGSEGLAVRAPEDLPSGLLLMVEAPRVLAPGQSAVLKRCYILSEKKSFGEATVTVLVKKS